MLEKTKAYLSAKIGGGLNVNPWRKIIFILYLSAILFGKFPIIADAQASQKLISLEEAYKMALDTHEQIRIAEKEIDKSKLLPYKALSSMLPQVDARGSYQMVNKPINTTIGNNVIVPKDQTFGDVKVSNSIFDPAYFPKRRQGYQTIDKSTNNYYQIIQDILFQVSHQYYLILRAKELISLDKEMLKRSQEEVRVAKAKYQSGNITEESVLRAELDQSTAENRFVEDTNLLKLSRDTLKDTIGLTNPDFELIKPTIRAEVPENYETQVGKAYNYRYDHKMAQTDIELAKTDVSATKAKFLPSVGANWEYYAVNHPSWEQESNNWYATVQVKLPVLEGGLRYWELKEKRKSLEQAKLSLDDKRRNIRIEVENALLTMLNNRSLLLKLQKQVETAQKNYDITFSKFNFGSATMLDVSQAYTTLFNSKTDLINKNFEYQLSLISVEKANGTFASQFIKETPVFTNTNYRTKR